jgi:glycosyltransferase involved in cell wall biosynthesis
MKLSIIIPLYNEKNTIEKLLKLIDDQTYVQKQIIIVDDFSKDNSLDLVQKTKLKSEVLILKHEKNRGKGACIKTAQSYVSGDIVIIQDADLEYDPSDYKILIDPIILNKTNVVYGSRVLKRKRYQNKNFISLIRIFFNHALTVASNIINSQNLTDAHTCYKVCKTEVFNKIIFVENDFAFCPEFTSKIARLNENILEIPISYHGRTYQEGKKIKSSDGLKAIIALLKYGFLKK